MVKTFMMNMRGVAIAAGLLIGGQVWGADLNLSTCAFPDVPELPDVALASMAQISAAGVAVRAYVTAVEGQLACLDTKQDGLGDEITTDQQALITSAYNSGVDTINEVAGAYNDAVRAYKARTE